MANEKTVAEKENATKEVVKDFNPPLDVPDTVDEPLIEDEKEPEEQKEVANKDLPKPEEEVEKVEVTGGSKVSVKPLVEVRCPDCPWKAGLLDENTYCSSCNGTGKVQAEPLE